MRKFAVALVMMFTSSFLFGQTGEHYERRFIDVTGSAEVVVAPEVIELEIILMEYTSESGDKHELAKIESKFNRVLRKHNVEKQDLFFGDLNFYWYYWWNYRNHPFKQRKFYINLDASTDFLSFIKDLDIPGVHAMRISNTSNSKLQELRREIKIEAMKAAKEKATYLLESIGEQVGCVLSVVEIPDHHNYYWRDNQTVLSNTVISSGASQSDIANVATIKLRYQVSAKFEIN